MKECYILMGRHNGRQYAMDLYLQYLINTSMNFSILRDSKVYTYKNGKLDSVQELYKEQSYEKIDKTIIVYDDRS